MQDVHISTLGGEYASPPLTGQGQIALANKHNDTYAKADAMHHLSYQFDPKTKSSDDYLKEVIALALAVDSDAYIALLAHSVMRDYDVSIRYLLDDAGLERLDNGTKLIEDAIAADRQLDNDLNDEEALDCATKLIRYMDNGGSAGIAVNVIDRMTGRPNSHVLVRALAESTVGKESDIAKKLSDAVNLNHKISYPKKETDADGQNTTDS